MVSALLHEIQRDAKHLSCAKAARGGKEGASKGSAAAASSSAADAALREAMEARTLDLNPGPCPYTYPCPYP